MTRANAMAAFLGQAGWAEARHAPLAGDASFRRYIRLHRGPETAMLMDAPPEHEDVRPYLAVAKRLHALNFAAPAVLAADPAQGFVLCEDLGDDLFSRVIAQGADEAALYRAAVDLLITWHNTPALHEAAPAPLPPYDHAVYLREALLLSEWFLPAARLSGAEEYKKTWEALLAAHPLPQTHFVHRDYHADNLLWLPNARVGLLDFQDALKGHPAYDLASLLEDARRDVPPALAQAELNRYISETKQRPESFLADYAMLAAQRNCKIIGIFTRLSRRDGKHHYLKLLPRVWAHLEHDLKHPRLAPLAAWFERSVPAALRGALETAA